MIPESLFNEGNIQEYRQPSKTYKIGNNVIAKKIDGIESVKQSVYHILSTERYSNPIYDNNYGVELEQYMGADFEIISATIETVLKDALMQDDRITNVYVNNCNKGDENGTCVVDFTVNTIFGTFSDSMNILT